MTNHTDLPALPEPDKTREALMALMAAVTLDRNSDFNSEHPAIERAMRMSSAALAASAPGRAGDGAPSELHALMELSAWRAAMIGLCQGQFPKTPEEAANHLRSRLKRATLTAQPEVREALTDVRIDSIAAEWGKCADRRRVGVCFHRSGAGRLVCVRAAARLVASASEWIKRGRRGD